MDERKHIEYDITINNNKEYSMQKIQKFLDWWVDIPEIQMFNSIIWLFFIILWRGFWGTYETISYPLWNEYHSYTPTNTHDHRL